MFFRKAIIGSASINSKGLKRSFLWLHKKKGRISKKSSRALPAANDRLRPPHTRSQKLRWYRTEWEVPGPVLKGSTWRQDLGRIRPSCQPVIFRRPPEKTFGSPGGSDMNNPEPQMAFHHDPYSVEEIRGRNTSNS